MESEFHQDCFGTCIYVTCDLLLMLNEFKCKLIHVYFLSDVIHVYVIKINFKTMSINYQSKKRLMNTNFK